MKHILSFILITILWDCFRHLGVDKHVHHSDHVMDVKGRVKEIVIDTLFIGG